MPLDDSASDRFSVGLVTVCNYLGINTIFRNVMCSGYLAFRTMNRVRNRVVLRILCFETNATKLWAVFCFRIGICTSYKMFISPFFYRCCFANILTGSLVSMVWRFFGLGRRKRPRDMKGSREYREQPTRSGPPASGLDVGLTIHHFACCVLFEVLCYFV
jgi:hypothetical protein